MINQWFSISEVELKTGIPHQTLRRYIKSHGHHLVLKKKHKSYLISEQSIKVIMQIRTMYSDGMNSEQVDESLVFSGIPMIHEVDLSDEQVSMNIPKTLTDMKKSIDTLSEKLSEQQRFNSKLIERLDEQHDLIIKQQMYIDEQVLKRDEQLIQVVREIQETKKLTAATEQPKKKWWKFWS